MKQIFLLLFAFAAIGVNAQITAASTVTGSNSGDGEIAAIATQLNTNDQSLQDSLDAVGVIALAASVQAQDIHGAMAFGDSATVVALTQNVWAKVTGPVGDLFIIQAQAGVTIDGDSITIVTDGDYVIDWSTSFNGSASDVFQICIYKNGVQSSIHMSRKTSNADTGNMSLPYYMNNLVAGDDISFYIRNTGDNDDATFVSGSIIIDLWHVD